MSCKTKILKIFNETQFTYSNHQRNIIKLTDIYQKAEFEDFIKCFINGLLIAFHKDDNPKNQFIRKTLDFCAKFCAHLSEKDDFLFIVMTTVLKEYSDVTDEKVRLNSCRFIAKTLENIRTELNNNLCDKIQKQMLTRAQDPKVRIRLEALKSLSRLQVPTNPNCPVIKEYLSAIVDANVEIRREVIKVIAPTNITIQSIKERILDINNTVRAAAYIKCSNISPKVFKIIDRQFILICAFSEQHSSVRNVINEMLISRWLLRFEGDYLQFLHCLILDADFNDMERSFKICQNLMEIFLKTHSLNEILEYLPIDSEQKLIPIDQLTYTNTIYWLCLVQYLSKIDDLGESLSGVVPELTHFSNYIKLIIEQKFKEKSENWQILNLNFILFNLFLITENYDLSDEVGRKTLMELIIALLNEYQFNYKLIEKMLELLEKCYTNNIDELVTKICYIISEIREPLTNKVLTVNERREIEINIARVSLEIAEREELKIQLLKDKNYQQLIILDKEIEEYQKQFNLLKIEYEGGEKIKMLRDDNETICRCLDIIIATLKLKSIKEINLILMTCKDEFILPLITRNDIEINWRVLKCLVILSIINEDIAKDNIQFISIPMITYRAIADHPKEPLIVSVSGICDLLSLYGIKLFCQDDEEFFADAVVSQNTTTTRTLYTSDNVEEHVQGSPGSMTFGQITEILLDMLDDEIEEIRHVSVESITRFIGNEFKITSSVISRIIIKWYNPITRKQDEELATKLGVLLELYTNMKHSKTVIVKAFLPTLEAIVNAPKTSPLADINLDNVLKFFAIIINRNEGNDSILNNSLAFDLCLKISNDLESSLVPFLIKMLLILEIDLKNTSDDLIKQIERLLKDLRGKNLRNLNKLLIKLKPTTTINNSTEQESEIVQTSSINTTNEAPIVSTSNKTIHKKRKLSKQSLDESSDFVIEDNTSSNENSSSTHLQTIREEEDSIQKAETKKVGKIKKRNKQSSVNVIEDNTSTHLETSREEESIQKTKPKKVQIRKVKKRLTRLSVKDSESETNSSTCSIRRSSRRNKDGK